MHVFCVCRFFIVLLKKKLFAELSHVIKLNAIQKIKKIKHLLKIDILMVN